MLLTLWWWLAGPGGFESIKLLWLAIILIASLILCFRRLWGPRFAIYRIKASLTVGLVLLSLLYASGRAAWSAAPVVAWLGSLNHPVGVAGYWIIGTLAILVLQLPSRYRPPRWALYVAAAGVAVWAVLQGVGGDGVNWTTFDDPARGRSLFGSIGSPGQLGITTALLGLLLLPNRHRSRQWGDWIAVAILTCLTLFSRSLTGQLMLVTGGWLWLAPRFRRLTLITLSVIWIAGSLLLSSSSTFRFRVSSYAPSLADRGALWQVAATAWWERPWWGWGPSHFQAAFDRHYPPERINARAVTEEQAHSLFWEVLVEFGLIGAILGVSLAVAAARELHLSPSLIPAATAWLIGALLNPVLVSSWSVALFMLLLAEKRPPFLPVTITPLLRTIVSTALVGITIFAASVGYQAVNRTITLDKSRQQAVNLEFLTAANQLRPLSVGGTAHPDLKLARAEALTNHSLKYGEWYDYAEVETLLSSLDNSPFFATNLLTLRLSQYWGANLPMAQADAARRETEFATKWQNHPRYQELGPQRPAQ